MTEAPGPLHGVEENVDGVAQYYAQYLLDNNDWGHDVDGNNPWDRLDTNAAISSCRDFLSVAENLAVFVTSGSSIPLPEDLQGVQTVVLTPAQCAGHWSQCNAAIHIGIGGRGVEGSCNVSFKRL